MADTTDEKVMKGNGVVELVKKIKGADTALSNRLSTVEASAHTHGNKALLDTYTQTEASLSDAVAKKHSHTDAQTSAMNSGITSSKVSSYDTALTYIPSQASADNQLADKAYVDAIGERLEARYLSASVYGEPFATHAALLAATEYYYNGELTTPDTNDVTVVMADEDHKGVTSDASTTRYRWVGDSDTGSWAFEYIINNSALSQSQLLAVNSGITSTKVSGYDSHLTDTNVHVTSAERATWNAKQDALQFNGTYDAEGNKVATETTVSTAIQALDGVITGTPGAGKTLTAFSETDGKVSATFDTISITKSQVSDFSHSHGNIANDGTISSDTTVASGDKLVITDSSGSNKVARSGISFDGSTTTTALTPKGTFESFAKSADITSAIQALDGTITGTAGASKTLSALSETDGKVSATFTDISITKSQVSDFSHSHGNITNAGALQTTDVSVATGDKLVITDNSDSGKVARSGIQFDGSTTTTALTPKGTFESFAKGADITSAIQALDGNITGTAGAGKTLSSLSETDGKISAAFTDISITKSQVSDFAHAHGNLNSDGTLQSSDIAIASGDKLVITDGSDSSKIARASVSFDGSTTTTALTPKGTFESFAKEADITAAIQALDGAITGTPGSLKTLTAFSETDGKVSATFGDISTMGGASATTAGSKGLVPEPAAGDDGKYLKGDGTWAVPGTVTETLVSDDGEYPLLMTPKGQTETTTTTATFDSGVTLNPSTNTISANVSGNAGSAYAIGNGNSDTSNTFDGSKTVQLITGAVTINASALASGRSYMLVNSNQDSTKATVTISNDTTSNINIRINGSLYPIAAGKSTEAYGLTSGCSLFIHSIGTTFILHRTGKINGSGEFIGNASTATTATTATNVGASVASVNVNRHVWFSSDTPETQRAYDNDFMYNPSTNVLTVGSITGTAATANEAIGTVVTDANSAIPALAGDDSSNTSYSRSEVFAITGSGSNTPNVEYNWHIISVLFKLNATSYRVTQTATGSNVSGGTTLFTRTGSSSDGSTWTFGTWLDANIDTKNTAGSTDTTSKIYLIGATSQTSSSQTYSDSEVYVQNGTMYLSKTTDASGKASNLPALIVGGTATTAHIEIDSNEVMAKSNGTTPAPLYLNNDGGLVYANGTLVATGASGKGSVSVPVYTNENGVITECTDDFVHDGDVASTYSSTGTAPVSGTAVASAIGELDAEVTSTDGANVQVKVTETDGKVTGVSVSTDNTAAKSHTHAASEVTGLATVATSGSYDDLTGKPTIDSEISSTSTNAVQNNVIAAELSGKLRHITDPSEIHGMMTSFVSYEISITYVSGVVGSFVRLWDVTSFMDGSVNNLDNDHVCFKGFFIAGKNQGIGSPEVVEIACKFAYNKNTYYLRSSSKSYGPCICHRDEDGVTKYYLGIYYDSTLYTGQGSSLCGLFSNYCSKSTFAHDKFIGDYTAWKTYPGGEALWTTDYSWSGMVSASSLFTSRNLQTNLASTAAASFNGTGDASIGVTGTLPITNGGTGATTTTGIATNIFRNLTTLTPSGDTEYVLAHNGTGGRFTLGGMWTYFKGKADTTYAAASHTHQTSDITGLATVATSGSYSDLSDKPSIPDDSTLVHKNDQIGGVNLLEYMGKVGNGFTRADPPDRFSSAVYTTTGADVDSYIQIYSHEAIDKDEVLTLSFTLSGLADGEYMSCYCQTLEGSKSHKFTTNGRHSAQIKSINSFAAGYTFSLFDDNGRYATTAPSGFSISNFKLERGTLATAYTRHPYDVANTVSDSELSSTSTYPVQNKVISAALDEKVSTTGTLQTTNPFAPSQYVGPYISKIDDAFYAFDKRWTATGTITTTDGTESSIASSDINKLFNGDYDTSRINITNGSTAVFHLTFPKEGNQCFPGYPYGNIIISFYYVAGPASIQVRVYNQYSVQTVGWKTLTTTDVSSSAHNIAYNARNPFYLISEIEITIVGDTTNSAGYTSVTEIEMRLDRPYSGRNPFLTKYIPETLYYSLTAPSFVGNLNGKLTNARDLQVKLDSTSAASFDGSADVKTIGVTGTLPISSGGTGATTSADALSNLGAASASHTHAASDITGLATVATTGSYTDLSNTPVIDSDLSSSSTHAVQNSTIYSALASKTSFKSINVTVPGSSTIYAKMTVPSARHTYLVFFNGTMGISHAEWLFRNYGEGGTARTTVNYIGAYVSMANKWYVEGSSGRVYYIEFNNTFTGAQDFLLTVNSLDGSSLPTLETAAEVPTTYVQLGVNGVVSAKQLETARSLKVNLASADAASFDGSADATSIGVSGALPIANGGTGATTASDARSNLGLGSLATKSSVSDSDISGTISDSHIASAATWNGYANLFPTEATSDNKLADKAYVDNLGTRLEARYIGSTAAGDPFATHAALTSATEFYYAGSIVTPDTNDVTTVLADEDHKTSAGEASTTRYRFTGTSDNPQWSFEYVINNSALSTDQLAAVNSGITLAKVTKLDGISDNATKTESSSANGNIKIDGTETTVYTHPSYTATSAAAVKVGMDSTGHVVIGETLDYSDLSNLPTIPVVDDEISGTSVNAVQNKVISAALDTKASLDSNNTFTAENVFTDRIASYLGTGTNAYGYSRKVFERGSAGTYYANWDSSYKDGAHFREWSLSFNTGVSFWGKIRITLGSSFSSKNSSGFLQKTIVCSFNTSTIYNNTGYYNDLGIHVEEEFRISDLVWNSTDSTWEIRFHSITPSSNNALCCVIVEVWSYDANHTNAFNTLHWKPSSTCYITTDTTYYTKRSGNASTDPTTGGVTFNWADKPVFQSPYGYEIFTTSHTIPIANGGTGATTAAGALSNLGAADDSKVVHTSGNETIAGDKTFSGSIYADGNIYGKVCGSNPRNIYGSNFIFYNCNTSTTSSYNFGLYQLDDNFQFTYRTSADNKFKGESFRIAGSNGVVTFNSTPKIGSYSVLHSGNVTSTYSSTGTSPVNGTAVASAISSKQDTLPTTGTATDTYAINVSGSSGKVSNALTINGTSYDGSEAKTFTLSTTDQNVKQGASTTANFRPIVLGYQSDTTHTTLANDTTAQVYTTNTMYAQPSTGMIAATSFKVAEQATFQYNSTDNSIDLVW